MLFAPAQAEGPPAVVHRPDLGRRNPPNAQWDPRQVGSWQRADLTLDILYFGVIWFAGVVRLRPWRLPTRRIGPTVT